MHHASFMDQLLNPLQDEESMNQYVSYGKTDKEETELES